MNADGPHRLKYGVTINNLLGVTLDGTVAEIGGKRLDSAGHDLLVVYASIVWTVLESVPGPRYIRAGQAPAGEAETRTAARARADRGGQARGGSGGGPPARDASPAE